jgi:predicted small lipoprotein YifL
MRDNDRKVFGLLSSLVLGSVVTLAGCEQKGPAEKAGENIDKAGQNIKDAVDPRGPVEKAGAKVDDAVNKP